MPRNPFEYYDSNDDIKDKAVWTYSRDADVSSLFEKTGSAKTSHSLSLKDLIQTRRLFVYFSLLGAFLVILWVRLFALQVSFGEEYRSSAEVNRIRTVITRSTRGMIYARDGEVLLRNIPNFTASVIPADLPKDDEERNRILLEFSELVEISYKEIFELIQYDTNKYSYLPVVIREHIPHERSLLLSVKSAFWPGISIDMTASREYLAHDSWSHVLGYIGQINAEEYEEKKDEGYVLNDTIGKTGLEFSYEDVLHGVHGKRQVEVDSLRKERRIIAEVDPVPGQGIVSSIDNDMQVKMSEILFQTLEKNPDAKGASAIVMNPNNGEVLALVSVPYYDNNIFVQGLSQDEYTQLLEDEKNPLFHRAVSGQYPSGSTFKMVVGAAALEEGVVDVSTTVLSTGGIRIGSWFFPDWKAGGHGYTDMRKALAESVNTYFYAVGGGYEDIQGLGIDRIHAYAKQFGLGSPLGIDIDGEASGFLPTKEWKISVKDEPWYIGDTYHVSIGQGDVLVTPLQVAWYTSYVANGGTLYKPRLVKAYTDINGEIQEEIDPEIIRSGEISTGTLRVIREGLRQTVTNGSAKSLQNLDIDVAGKTGTAQASQNQLHAWFTGFAPYDDPELVFTVLVENGGEGSSVAVPVVREFLEWYQENYTYMH